MNFRNGLDSLLRPEDSVLVLIDHQPFQLANLNSHDPQMVVNNTTALAKLAKAFNVPTILTSAVIDTRTPSPSRLVIRAMRTRTSFCGTCPNDTGFGSTAKVGFS
jgi:nicotinamidase-related amidase